MTMNIEPLNVFQKLHQCYSYFSVLNYNRRKNLFVILVWMTIYKSKLLTFAKLVKIRRHSVEPVPNNTLDKNYSENINYVAKYKTSLSICKALGTFLGNLNKKVFILTNTYSRPKFTCPSPFCDFFFTIVQLITMRWKNLRFFLFTHVFTRRNYHDQNYISYGGLYLEIVDSFHHLEVTRNTVQIFQRYYLGSFFSVARLDPCGRIYF